MCCILAVFLAVPLLSIFHSSQYSTPLNIPLPITAPESRTDKRELVFTKSGVTLWTINPLHYG